MGPSRSLDDCASNVGQSRQLAVRRAQDRFEEAIHFLFSTFTVNQEPHRTTASTQVIEDRFART